MKFTLLSIMLMLSLISTGNALELEDSNTVSLRESFSKGSVARVITKLQQIHSNLPSHESVNLYIYSPGGSIVAGDELIKFINSLNRPINVVCDFCASMAFQTLQGVKGKRLVTNFGVLMSHKAYGGFEGEFPGQIENRLNFWLDRINKMDQITVNRSNGKQTLDSYRAMYENEYWCTDSSCIKDGFADEVINVTCGKSLSGTKKELVDTMFGTFEVVISKCPLVTGILQFRQVNEDGEPTGPYINNGTKDLSDLLDINDGNAIKKLNMIKM